MKSIATIVGARPQFVKAAAVSREIRKEFNEILIHTGQHYAQDMSDVFFEELMIPQPDYNLNVGSGTHGEQTAKMLTGIEAILLEKKPDYVLLYGDTNSTLAGALAASKIHMPIIHVEAGLRSFNMRMPEEQNRILSDRLSSILFCPTETAVENLKNEGIVCNVYNVGDVMCDMVLFYSKHIQEKEKEYFLSRLRFEMPFTIEEKWYLATIHRAENTDTVEKIENILAAFEQLDYPVLFPVHPRIFAMTQTLNKKHSYKNIAFAKPMGYLDMLFFTKNAEMIITDSGGLQKEAFILGKNCVTVRDQTEWLETLTDGHNILAKPDTADICNKINIQKAPKRFKNNIAIYGGGKATQNILDILRLQRS